MSEQSKYEQALSQYSTTLDDTQVAATVKRIIDEKVPANDTLDVKKFLMGSVELTTLKTTDSDQSVTIPNCPTLPPSACIHASPRW